MPRPVLRQQHPVHVTLRIVRRLPSFRGEVVFARVRAALDAARRKSEATKKTPFQIVHWSVQNDHLHLIVEARDKKALRSGVSGLEVRIVRKVNALLRRKGRVFADRYHRHDLRSARQVRNALRYVLHNLTEHAIIVGDGAFADPCSSAATFDGWSGPIEVLRFVFCDTEPWAPVRPRTWLLQSGWRTDGGRLSPSVRLGSRGRHRR